MTKQEEFLKMYKPVHSSFERYCRSRSYGMDHRDIMNESLLIAFQKLDKIENEKAFFSFLCGIARNVFGNYLRKKKNTSLSSEEIYNYHLTVENEEKLDVEILYKSLSLLPDEQQEAVVLFEISGFSIKEICEIQNASESAVKQRLKRGREKLSNLLQEKQYALNTLEHATK